MNKILITGVNGFVGKSLAFFLKSKSFELTNTRDINRINLCEWDSVKNIPRSEIIVHLASKNFVPESFTVPHNYYYNNFLSTLNILEKAKIDGSKVIFFSTYVYGHPLYLPIDEEHLTSPQNPYTHSKLICEELCKAYYRDFGVPVTIFRPFNIYGPGQKESFFIPTIINQVKHDIIHLKDSRPKRDFIFIDDVIDAIVKSIISNSDSFRIYNLGSGISTSIKDIVEMIINLTQSKACIHFSNEIRQGEILETVADCSHLKCELLWNPHVSIENGIRLCIDFNKKNN